LAERTHADNMARWKQQAETAASAKDEKARTAALTGTLSDMQHYAADQKALLAQYTNAARQATPEQMRQLNAVYGNPKDIANRIKDTEDQIRTLRQQMTAAPAREAVKSGPERGEKATVQQGPPAAPRNLGGAQAATMPAQQAAPKNEPPKGELERAKQAIQQGVAPRDAVIKAWQEQGWDTKGL
jgi:hypothetical protein